MSYSNINNPANYQLASFGQFGFRKISTGGTGTANEQYRVVYALEDTTVTVVSYAGDDLAGEFLLAGTAVYGLFSEVVVVEGSVLAYIA
tara:strand:- start:194 stop:460 length:267 start_codon:yes stop_codon:yes gene_type:complete